jgi:agmatinase
MAASGPPTLVGLAYDRGSSHLRGAAEAPVRIRDALQSPATNSWSETGVDVSEHLRDAGDVRLSSNENPRPVIVDAITDLLEQDRRPLALGGDHSVTHPILRAVRPDHPQLTILQIDAHPDLYDTFEGDPYSHACPFARIMEEDRADRLVQVGIRTMPPPQRQQAERFKVDVVSMRDWGNGTRPNLTGPVYVSIDLDALDPAFAPGVSHREPGGLSVRDVLRMLRTLDGPIVGGDVVEFNPRQDMGGRTAPVCAKLVTELAGQMVKTSASTDESET